MIQFDRVALGFGGHQLFDEASFTLQKGERCGLVGRNGSGKSTIMRLINEDFEPDKGSISIPKDYRIGYLQQHIDFKEPTLIQEAALGLPEHEKDHIYKAEKILFGLGFSEEDLDASPSKFSGGYQLRLHLAKVLISEPNCLLLDEPTNYLDIISIRWLMNFLSKWKGEFILISHDRDFMDKVTTHTMGIHRQKLRKIKGTSIDFFTQILTEEEVYEKTRLKTEKRKAHLQSFVDRFGAKASKAGQAQSKMKLIAKEPVLEKLNQMSELSFSFHEAPFPGKKMLHAKDLEFSYTEEPLIENFSLEIEKEEKIAIIGKNGRGKSTLLRLIGGDLSPKKGSVAISENTKMGYFGQTNIDRLNSKHSIEQEISAADPQLNYTQVKAIAGAMMFSGALSAKKISVLSGGEKSRVLLGKMIAKPCNLLLLDEPTHHLDIESIEALIDALEEFSGSIIIVTHSELILRRLELNKIILCEEGKQTTFLGTYDEFLEKMGWDSDKKPKAPPKEKPPVKVTQSKPNLRPLEKQIEECEKKMGELESQQKIEHALPNKNPHSHEHFQKLAKLQKETEELEAKLLSLYDDYEKLKALK